MSGAALRLGDPVAVAKEAVDLCMARGATAADARVVRLAQEELVIQDGRVREAGAPEDFGLAVRVLKDGAVGFAAAPGGFGSIADVAPGVARRALAVARDVAPLRRAPVQLSGDASSSGEYHTPVEEDPFLVPL